MPCGYATDVPHGGHGPEFETARATRKDAERFLHAMGRMPSPAPDEAALPSRPAELSVTDDMTDTNEESANGDGGGLVAPQLIFGEPAARAVLATETVWDEHYEPLAGAEEGSGDRQEFFFDVAIVGGGPAGLSAALILGRCRRSVVVLDAGEPRNCWSRAMHGFLTRDGIPPREYAEMARRDLATYPTVKVRDKARVVDVRRAGALERGFELMVDDGSRLRARRLLLATGLIDDVPEVPGLRELYGHTVHHCPICDGWEYRDRRIAVYSRGGKGFGLAVEMTAWTRELALLTDGPAPDLDAGKRAHLAALGISLDERPVERLVGDGPGGVGGMLREVVFGRATDGGAAGYGKSLPFDALFFCTGTRQRSDLFGRLGCDLDNGGCVWVGRDGASTSVEGVYCAGDMSKNAQLVIVAAAEGAQAAVLINRSLTREYKEAALGT